jgi:hypothetical protein
VQYIWANVAHANVTHVDNAILHRVPSHNGHRLKDKALLQKRRKTVNTTIHPLETTVTIELPSTYSNENM